MWTGQDSARTREAVTKESLTKTICLLGLFLLSVGGCNKDKAKAPEAVAEGEQGLQNEGRGEGRGHRRFCEGPDAEARLAKMQKCQSEATATCNTKVYGTATPTKDALCGDKEKMKEVWQCVRAQYGDDKEKQRADRQKMRECMGGAGTED